MSEYDPPKTDPRPEGNDDPPAGDSITGQDVQDTFNFESLFLACAVIALGVGVCFVNPGLGVLILLLSAPALVRAFAIGALRRSRGETPSLLAKVLMFFTSALLVVLVCGAALIAFVAICFPIGLAAFSLDVHSGQTTPVVVLFGGAILGVVAAIAILYFGYRLLFWRKW